MSYIQIGFDIGDGQGNYKQGTVTLPASLLRDLVALAVFMPEFGFIGQDMARHARRSFDTADIFMAEHEKRGE